MRSGHRLVLAIVLICLPVALAFGGGRRERSDVFSEAQLTDLNATIARAAASGIPESTLQARVDEGVAKGARAEEIVQALDRKIRLMEQSRELLESIDGGSRIRSSQTSWEWTAIMLEAGVSASEIRDIAEASLEKDRPADYRNATTAFLELTRAGLTRGDAQSIANALLRSRMSSDQFLNVDLLILRAGTDSGVREDIVSILLEQLPQADSLNQLDRIIRTYIGDAPNSSDRAGGGSERPGTGSDADDDSDRRDPVRDDPEDDPEDDPHDDDDEDEDDEDEPEDEPDADDDEDDEDDEE